MGSTKKNVVDGTSVVFFRGGYAVCRR